MRDDPIDLTSPGYTPVRLLNETAHFLHCKNDAMLALVLDFEHAQLSRIRHRKTPVTYRLMVAIQDLTDWTIRRVRELAGMPFNGGVLAGASLPHRQKLSDEDVLAIRAMPGRIKAIAEKFKVSKGHVYLIKRGETRRRLFQQ